VHARRENDWNLRLDTLVSLLRAVLTSDQDAFGHLLSDLVAGRRVFEVVERDDGSVFTFEPDFYLAPFRSWWSQERRAMRFVRGRVLDFGCGAGRVGLHLQSRGYEVVGIDVSPLAVEVARQRGLADARLGTLENALRPGERFDTILLLGNNLGLLAGERQGRRLLRKLARVATDKGRILAGSYDPYDGASEFARRYQARSRARGKMGGVERLRVRYRQYATPWYDVLFASREEVERLVEGTGWVASRFVDDGPGYVVVLELKPEPGRGAAAARGSGGRARRARPP
jgi:SAM-dependent methyltransferase